MEKYTVYFKVFDKKMKVTVDANNPEHAKSVVIGMVNFDKVVESKDNSASDEMDDVLDRFNKLFGR